MRYLALAKRRSQLCLHWRPTLPGPALIAPLKAAISLFYLAGAIHTIVYYPIAAITTLVASLRMSAQHFCQSEKRRSCWSVVSRITCRRYGIRNCGFNRLLPLVISLATSGVSAVGAIGAAFVSVRCSNRCGDCGARRCRRHFQRLAPVRRTHLRQCWAVFRQAFGGIKSVLTSFWQDVKAGFEHSRRWQAAFSAIATFVSAGDLSSAFSTLTAPSRPSLPRRLRISCSRRPSSRLISNASDQRILRRARGGVGRRQPDQCGVDGID